MTTPKIKLGLNRMTVEKKITFGREVADSLANNHYFKGGDEYSRQILQLTQELLDARAKSLAAFKRAQSQLEIEHQLEEQLGSFMLRTARFVEDQSDGDPAKMESAGLSIYYPGRSGPVGILPAPTGVVAETGTKDGEVLVHWEPQRKAKSFVVQYTTDATGLNGWVTFGNPTRSNVTITGLKSLARYKFRVASVSTAGESAWSDPAAGVAM